MIRYTNNFMAGHVAYLPRPDARPAVQSYPRDDCLRRFSGHRGACGPGGGVFPTQSTQLDRALREVARNPPKT